jgi:UDP-glucose 4-epimerase
MAQILVTGGAGFIGSHLCEQYVKKGHQVTALDMSDGNKVEHLTGHENFQFIQGSVLDGNLMRHEIEKCDILVHLAAIADPKKYVDSPLNVLDIDLRASLNIFSMAAEKRKKIFFASTSEIFGKNMAIPWKEDADRVLGSSRINRWCYSTAKSACEHYLFAYFQQEKVPFVAVRFFNVYGPRLDDLGSGRVIPIFLKHFFSGDPVFIHGDGGQTRTFVYITDVAQALYKLTFSRKCEGEIFNVGSDREVSILELAQVMKKVGSFRSEIRFITHREVFGESYEDIPRRVPDVSKIKKYIGWQARTSLEKGLRLTIDYYRSRHGL